MVTLENSSSERLLTENDVIASVNRDLIRKNWTIISFCDTSMHGVDIHAKRGQQTLYVEAKGVTSSKASSSRFGKLQDSSQLFIQVAAALYTCSKLRSMSPEAAIAIAVPSHPKMRRRIDEIKVVLEKVEISVIWVDDQLSVTYWNASWAN